MAPPLPADPLDPLDPTPPRLAAGLWLAWAVFWLLMVAVGLQRMLQEGGRDLWRPVVDEGSSMLVATGVALLQWRLAARLDPLLHRPWRWFVRVLVWLPLLAPAFVAAIYALRHGVYTLRGLPYRHEPWPAVLLTESLTFAIFFVLFTGVQFGVRSYLAWTAERLRAERAQRLSQQAQLLQLTQQLQPHFLFNALNTVSSLIHEDAERADALLTQLAVLLRAATDAGQRPEHTLGEELQLLRAYGAVMHERFASRVELRWSVDDCALACRVPTLGLQPLLENCFVHGVERRAARTTLEVRAVCAGGRLVVEIADDAATAPGSAPPVFGVGLGNLQRRLEALHGPQARLALRPREGGAGMVARVELPCAC